ncbi:MAG: type II toxin-antitoxin system YafQ family toxin [Clostridium sp.]|nr:type II toxin-antitoxin system YafQ family toxin [Clostridium sp.]
MLSLQTTTQFRRDRKLAIKCGLPMKLMDEILQTLVDEKPLNAKYRDHELKGIYAGLRECHILPDRLLIYDIDGERLILTAIRTGSHSDLF